MIPFDSIFENFDNNSSKNLKMNFVQSFTNKEQALEVLKKYQEKGFEFKEKTFTEKTFTHVSDNGEKQIVISYVELTEDNLSPLDIENAIKQLEISLNKEIERQNFEKCAELKQEISKLKNLL